MKKTIILFLSIFTIFLFGMNSSIQAAEPGSISVEATSQIDLIPDVVDFSVEIVTTSKDSMSKAVAENKNVCAKVYDNLKKMNENNPENSVKTLNYSATPVYRYNNNKRVLDYYQVKNSLKVHTHDVQNVGKMIDTATANGATSVNNISYSISKYDAESTKLLADTAKKAREQGDNLAKAMGSEITGIKSISSSCSFSSHSYLPRMMMLSKSVSSTADGNTVESSTNIEVGTMTLNARVNAVFYVK